MNALDTLRATLAAAVAELPPAELPDLIGALAAASARAQARLTVPAPTVVSTELVTAETVAERFNLAVSSVHELARQGRIPCRMFGRFRRFDLAEVAAAGLDSKSARLAPETRREKAA